MFITVNSIDTNAPVIINTAHLVGILSDDEGTVLVQMVHPGPGFKIAETIDQMEKLLNVANM